MRNFIDAAVENFDIWFIRIGVAAGAFAVGAILSLWP